MNNTNQVSQNTTEPVAKFILKIKDGDVLKDVGNVIEREGKNGSIFMIVEGTDLLIGTTQDGRLLLKKKATDPNAQYKYEILGQLFKNHAEKTGKPWYRAETRDKVEYVMFPLSPNRGHSSGGGKGGYPNKRPAATAEPATSSGGFQRRA